jgi:RNA polymerase sigma-70 factor (ECF subfamily)
MAWIMTIARNLCLMRLRQASRTEELSLEDWKDYLETNEELSTIDRIVLTECMSRLSDQERQIVVLHVVSGFKHREIANMLELNLSTVLSKYNRAIRKLKTFIEKENGS